MFKVTLCFAPIFFKRKAEYEVLCCVSDDSSGGEFISLEKWWRLFVEKEGNGGNTRTWCFKWKRLRYFFYWSLVIDLGFPWCLFLTLSYGSKQQALHIFFVFPVFVFFLLFLCESNSNLLTRSQRALSCLILVRYSIKSLCYNPSSVLIAFYHMINFFFFFRFAPNCLSQSVNW